MRRSTAALVFVLSILVSAALANVETQGPAGGLRVLSHEGARSLPTTAVGNQEFVALDEVATLFGLTLREDRLAGGITASSGARSIIITSNQPVVSVAGRLVSLSAAPVRQGARWLLPLDFLQRAVGPALETRLELRRPSRLLVVGDLRVPRITTRVDSSSGGAALVFDSTPPAQGRVSLEGGRLTVSFDADALDLTLPSAFSHDFVQSLQAGDTSTSVRIVPGPRFGLYRATSAQPDPNASRLTIELLPAATEAPPTPAPSPAPAPATSPADPLTLPLATTALRTVVIDPGHGGHEVGVRGPAGTLEKDVTLAVARRLRTMIEGRLGLRVYLTRDDDRAISLDDRAAYANSQKADLFLSIHANASLGPAMRGAEVYYLGLDRVAADAQANLGAPGSILPALGGLTRAIELVPWETAQLKYLPQSSTLAGLVEQALGAAVAMSARPVQQAPFRILVGANMPAVLVEIGYLSNPEQERTLVSGPGQDQIATALFNGIVQYRGHVERASTGQPR